MIKFKVGDKVECIDRTFSPNIIYTITAIDEFYIKLEGLSGSYYPHRFKLIKERGKYDKDIPKIDIGDRIILLQDFKFGLDYRRKGEIIEITSINYSPYSTDGTRCHILGFKHSYSNFETFRNISEGRSPNWCLVYGVDYELYRKKKKNFPKEE